MKVNSRFLSMNILYLSGDSDRYTREPTLAAWPLGSFVTNFRLAALPDTDTPYVLS